MPQSFHHLVFELYSTADTSSTTSSDKPIKWRPGPEATIFDDFRLLAETELSPRRAVIDSATQEEIAASDWRCGQVSVVSMDPYSSEAGSSRAGPAAAPMLGPTFSGAGTSTKAECIPVDIGWGVVHFYRDGEEIPRPSQAAKHGADEEEEGDADYTTLCVPAVPTYMSPGDFVGFVGEKWLSDISHCRLVMTSKMKRYLALLKFRSNDVAKEWKRTFDGKVFNTMEVSLPQSKR